MLRGVIPEPIARQPWQVILPLVALTTFGSTVLYSAAGGSLRPWALTHLIRFFVFLVMAIGPNGSTSLYSPVVTGIAVVASLATGWWWWRATAEG